MFVQQKGEIRIGLNVYGRNNMLFKSGKSRIQLEWSKFKKTEDGDWILIFVEVYYSKLFEQIFPQIMKNYNTEWRVAKNGKTYYCLFNDLKTRDKLCINKFIKNFSKYVILGLNDHIVHSFTDELDFIVALNYNAESPVEMAKGNRTKVGQSVFLLKNRFKELHDVLKKDHYNILKNEICEVIKYLKNGFSVGKSLVTSIPFIHGVNYNLPNELVELVVSEMNTVYQCDDYSFLKSKLMCDKPAFKNITLDKKINLWEDMYSKGNIELSCSVEDSDVYIIDDLYQSGATMWSYAKFLKSQGANKVFGIPCVKTLRDSDNK